ncbi:MAG: hypothetical protein ABI398_14765 [Devosia sp.]
MDGILTLFFAVGTMLWVANLVVGLASGVMKLPGQYGLRSEADRSTNPTQYWLWASINIVGAILFSALALTYWQGR